MSAAVYFSDRLSEKVRHSKAAAVANGAYTGTMRPRAGARAAAVKKSSPGPRIGGPNATNVTRARE